MLAEAFFRGVESRSITIDRAHPRDPAAAALFGSGRESTAGIQVNDEVALAYSAVFACVKVLAETFGSVPLHVYERVEGGKRRADDHALYDLLHQRANRYNTSAEWRESSMLNIGLRGNAISEIVQDSRGNVSELWPLRVDRIMPLWKDGKLWYVVQTDSGPRALRPEQVLHQRCLGWGLWGLSPIDYAREAIGLGVAAEKFNAKFLAQGAAVAGVLKVPQTLSLPAYERLKREWSNMREGLENAHRTAILEGGMDYESIGVTPENAQFLESRQFQVVDVARWYRVPLHMIQELTRATFSNIEHQSIEFVKFTMLPHYFKAEQAFLRDLFGPREGKQFFAEFSLDGLERGDTAARSAYYREQFNIGALSPNEIRALENRNARPGGDAFFVPLNIAPSGGDGGAPPAAGSPPVAARSLLLPVASDASRRLARSAARELDKIAKRRLVAGDVEGFATDVGELWSEQERRAAEVLTPIAIAAGRLEQDARRAAAVWCTWAGEALTGVRDIDGLASLQSRWLQASEIAGAAILASLVEA